MEEEVNFIRRRPIRSCNFNFSFYPSSSIINYFNISHPPMSLKKITLPILLFISIIVFLSCTKDSQDRLYVINGNTMGTMYTVKFVKEKGVDRKYEKITDEIDSVLVAVNRQMSTYIKDSEISRFNRYGKTDWYEVSLDLATVIKHSIRISEKSNGAFDITIGPLVNLWGFGAEARAYEIPNDKDIKDRMKYSGYQNVSVRMSPPAIKKDIPEIYCDLAAIAKGFGVDAVSEYLDSQDISNYLVEIGGEVRARGINHRGVEWRIGVSTPDNRMGIQKAISISDRSIATSGDYWNYFEKDGVRYSHTIDPRTGRPITHKLASVTVIHDSCMVADALATAIDVLGPENGYDFAVKEELSVFMIIKTGDGFIEKTTPKFDKILSKEHNGN